MTFKNFALSDMTFHCHFNPLVAVPAAKTGRGGGGLINPAKKKPKTLANRRAAGYNRGRRKAMPLLEYKCPRCGKKFEELVKGYDEEVVCPSCGNKAEREWSGEIFSATGKPAKHCNGDCKHCNGC